MTTPSIDVTQIIDAARDEVTKAAITEVKQQLQWTVGRRLAEEINPIVVEFVKAEIVPDLKALLFEQKSVILEAAAQAAVIIGTAVAEQLTADAAKAMNNGYSRGKIIDAIFGK
jgi:Na+-transporting methylmalonyl-CoA/oxaloacetate decarboxylase beta subunit